MEGGTVGTLEEPRECAHRFVRGDSKRWAVHWHRRLNLKWRWCELAPCCQSHGVHPVGWRAHRGDHRCHYSCPFCLTRGPQSAVVVQYPMLWPSLSLLVAVQIVYVSATRDLILFLLDAEASHNVIWNVCEFGTNSFRKEGKAESANGSRAPVLSPFFLKKNYIF